MGLKLGCIGAERGRAFAAKLAALEAARAQLDRLSLTTAKLKAAGVEIVQDGVTRTARELLRFPAIDMGVLKRLWPEELGSITPEIAALLETDGHYAAYLERQDADIAAFRRDESLILPDGLDYAAIPGLSTEVKQKLSATRPATLGQAARTEGVTPGALTALLGYVRRGDVRRSA